MPTVNVDLFDTKITVKQKRQLAESLTKIVSETFSYPIGRILIVFRTTPSRDIARGGKLGSLLVRE